MNHCVPTWHIDGASLPFSPEFISESDRLQPIEKEVQELVWRNGRLDTQDFNQKTPRPGTDGFSGDAELGTLCIAGRPKQDLPESDVYAALLGSDDPCPPPFIQEDEMASWLHYPLEDTVDYRDLFAPPQAATAPVDRNSVIPTSGDADLREDTPRKAVHPPRPHVPVPESKIVNFSLFAGRTAGTARSMGSERDETVSGSLFCDRVESTVVDSCVGAHGPQVTITPSSHHPSRTEPKAKAVIPVEGIKEPARSTSDRHGSTLVSAPSRKDRKRKAREAEDSDSHSEDAYEDRTVSTKIRPSRAKRRNRAAEVHNLSERRRRDRINEKMRALQELIPRCNKSDKASMLDEAIEYLKSLQLQVQMMSVGCGMPQMLYPGLQFPLMPPPLGMGMVPGSRHPAVMPFPPVIPRLAVPSPGAGTIFPSLPPMARLQMNSTEPILTPIQPATLAEYQQYLSQLHMAAPTTRVPLPSSASVGKSGEPPTATSQEG